MSMKKPSIIKTLWLIGIGLLQLFIPHEDCFIEDQKLFPKTIKVENCSPLFLGAKGEIYTPGYYTIQNLCGLSNEMLRILEAQGAAKLQEVKIEGPKK